MVMPAAERLIDPGPADLERCSREPIHIPGAIQPHGLLVVARAGDRQVTQVTENLPAFVPIPPGKLLGSEIEHLFVPEDREKLIRVFSLDDFVDEVPLKLRLADAATTLADVNLHRQSELVLTEIEPVNPEDAGQSERFQNRVRMMVGHLQAAPDLAALCQRAAEHVRSVTGFDRVMVYRFDADWNGRVVGESLARSDVDSYADLHFPASDIPAQARELYRRNWLRLIVNSSYTPAKLVPILNPLTETPLDLSECALRSVSPIHLEYLRNMKVGASMSVSLIRDGQLWGLIACHHAEPRHLSSALRGACELIGQVSSAQIAAKEEAERLAAILAAKSVQAQFFEVLAKEDRFVEALKKYTPRLLEMTGSSGAALCVAKECSLLGETPTEQETIALWHWLRENMTDPILATDHLAGVYPPAAAFTEKASGLLAISLTQLNDNFVLWFRPEVISTVTWAGNPEKAVEEDAQRLSPRKSFAAWKQTVRAHSRAWSEIERSAGEELRSAINASIFRRADQLLRLNAELEKKNTDLNSFAYIAAHDLREPVRGVKNFTQFLIEDVHDKIPAESQRQLTTVHSLAGWMNTLLDALAHYSQNGRMELSPVTVDLNKLASGAIESLSNVIATTKTEVKIARPLPTISCDELMVREVFQNLIANAIRYNDQENKVVEISYRDPENERPPGQDPAYIFTVSDNGIGIRDKDFDRIFRMFRRLHLRGERGDGTGAGLAIVKSVVERHGGKVWVESAVGEGTTFLFTLTA